MVKGELSLRTISDGSRMRMLIVVLFILVITTNPMHMALSSWSVRSMVPPDSGIENLGGNASMTGETEQLHQFTAGGHVIGFRSTGVWIASGDHLLSLKFLGAQSVKPLSDQVTAERPKPQPLSSVTYHGLWPGVDVNYESIPGGVIKSSYSIKPNASVSQIRFEYNRPPKIQEDGSLLFSFETGQMVESAPEAWQEIDGSRKPVECSFQLYSDQIVGFKLGKYHPNYPLVIDPAIHWHTFMGTEMRDKGMDITVYSSEIIFVTGTSQASWGTPIAAHSGGEDAFVAELDNNGVLVWNTFLGGSGDDEGVSITHDGAANIYISGESNASWGTPVRAYSGNYDAFVAKLNTNGTYLWHTFLGSGSDDYGRGISYNNSPILVVTGYSAASWGTPVRAYSGSFDAFVASLSYSTGALLWNTFLGGTTSADRGMDIIATSTEILTTGYSNQSWGSPYRAHSGNNDAYLVSLETDGDLDWNTFMGSSAHDYGYSLALDSDGAIYVTGTSMAHWESTDPPVRAYSGGDDGFVVKFNSGGLLLWNTFLGSPSTDNAYGVAIHGNDDIYVIGYSNASWGTPGTPHAGDNDTFLVNLAGDGTLSWNTFKGSPYSDKGNGITLSPTGVPFIVGESASTWGDYPVRMCHGYDAFVGWIDTSGGTLWNTFLGSAGEDVGFGIALDSNYNIIVAGYSPDHWGTSPKRAHAEKDDGFVAKLSLNGSRVWHTFLGGSQDDIASGVAVNSSDEIYVIGWSEGTWGSSPIRPFSGTRDAFVAKLNSNGSMLWNTFLGSEDEDLGIDVYVYGSDNINVSGYSSATWGSPVRSHTAMSDAFVAELDSNGSLKWNTFLGGPQNDRGRGIVVDDGGNIYISGYSYATWGTPIRDHHGPGVPNGMVAKLNTSGTLLWNTFLGSTADFAHDIDRDSSGNLYVIGTSYSSWGSPIRPCQAWADAFVAKLDNTGKLVWNTCLGSEADWQDYDEGYGICVDSDGNVYATGYSEGTWGTPSQPHVGDGDIFVAKLDTYGQLLWNTFQGSTGFDTGYGIVRLSEGQILVTGEAFGPFVYSSSAPYEHNRGVDAFVIHLGDWFNYLPLVIR